VRHVTYLAVLAACLVGTAPLERVLHTHVYRRWRRLICAVTPGLALGLGWDAWAVHAQHWSFDGRYLMGAWLGRLPVEEVLFFVIIPSCAVLTLEAVRGQRPRWIIGDEVDRDGQAGKITESSEPA
jgi:lycopene cyclase domain-containing protein